MVPHRLWFDEKIEKLRIDFTCFFAINEIHENCNPKWIIDKKCTMITFENTFWIRIILIGMQWFDIGQCKIERHPKKKTFFLLQKWKWIKILLMFLKWLKACLYESNARSVNGNRSFHILQPARSGPSLPSSYTFRFNAINSFKWHCQFQFEKENSKQ